MDLEQFYITLPSNVNSDSHINNTLANYTTELYHPLKFDYPYEVALVEVTFPSTIDETDSIVLGDIEVMDLTPFVSETIRDHPEISSVSITIGEYNSKNFLKIINSKLEKAAMIVQCSPAPQLILTQRNSTQYSYQFNNFNKDHRVLIYGDLADLLGFNRSHIGIAKRNAPLSISHLSLNQNTEITTSINGLFIYTNIIKHQFVGNSYTQLLRLVAVDNTTGTQTKTYSSPHYVPLSKNYIDSIEITIKDDSDNLIHFKTGIQKVYIKLHFRPSKYGF